MVAWGGDSGNSSLKKKLGTPENGQRDWCLGRDKRRKRKQANMPKSNDQECSDSSDDQNFCIVCIENFGN